MRIMIKGGVWKNTEDEILKAAVMKYGKNQWARVASLLNRKSAKQCKARWYEWLDPSIKKTEWTRDEEEKLLHLAKLYPCQWRTVAPLVGRTAAQCMERYERLLDDAEREIAGEGGAEGGGSSEEVRRLRPGEIDPNPEVRPARPDPVDMDEDEKEMLSEARARLANTRGKKAKRKAREAQLDEARRLASLQKKRELKAAGIYTSRFGGRSNKKYMDYDAEVPFQKLAPAGFYDVSGEKRADGDRKRSRGDADFEAIRLDRFEEQRRDAAEKIAARDDKKKVQKLMKANLPLAVAQLSALNDPSSVLRRSELALPAPQVTDEELEDIARLGADSDGGGSGPAALLASGASGADVVANLLANARARTPARPRTEDAVAQEARNAIADRSLQTPLLGEDQADREAGTGYAGATPLTGGRVETPSALSLRGPTPAKAGTPLGLTQQKAPTPLRDVRDDESAFESAYGDAEDLRADRKRARVELKAGLEGLPAPKFAYDVDAPADDDAPEPASRPARTPDAADRDAAEAAAAREAARAELALRSSAVRRDLPRPRKAPAAPRDAASPAAALVEAELVALLRRDAHDFPVKGGPKKVARADVEAFDEKRLVAAAALIQAEADATMPAAGPDFGAAWEAKFADVVYFPDAGAWGSAADCADESRLVAAHKAAFEATRATMAKGAARAARIEERVDAALKPIVDECEKLREEIDEAAADLDQAAIEAACYKRLHRLEKVNLPARLAAAKARCAANDAAEKVLQQEYARLKRAVDDMDAAAA